MNDERQGVPETAYSNEESKAATRRWLERWRTVGPLLDDERWARLQASSDAELRQHSWDLMAMWQPGSVGDDAEGLLLLQRQFARLRERGRT